MADEEKINNLNQVIDRLIAENARTRQKIEEIEIILRRRATNVAGLKLASAIKNILDDRDKTEDRIQFFREELRKILGMLGDGQAGDAARQITHFLFKNPR